MVKAVIFDCFGVIVGKGFNYTYSLAGGDPLKDKMFIENILAQANLGLISDDDFRNALANNLGIPLSKWSETVQKADLPDETLLSYIKNNLRPKYKTAILSNANNGVIERKIGENNIEECFDVVVVSADVGLVKPDPRIYQITLDRLGVESSECILVDDRQIFLDQANRMGMKSLLFKDFNSFKSEIERLLH
jgi:FMN phosphatase YigB (HAD superfamily)